MTNEEFQAHVKALNEASARGDIQFASAARPGEWLAVGGTFIDAKIYRIKPQPREVWIAEGEFDHGAIEGGFVTDTSKFSPTTKWRKFREVLE